MTQEKIPYGRAMSLTLTPTIAYGIVLEVLTHY